MQSCPCVTYKGQMAALRTGEQGETLETILIKVSKLED